jgi:mRNA interferase RelE/StbE
MSYSVVIPRSVEKEILRLPEQDYDRVVEALEKLRLAPRPRGSGKLSGRGAWRVRVGNYRIIYEIDDAQRLVVVVVIRHRKEVYRS